LNVVYVRISVDVQGSLEVALQDLDFADDLVDSCGPGEWCRPFVLVGDVVVDVLDKLPNDWKVLGGSLVV
jgi:hypothetical protein